MSIVKVAEEAGVSKSTVSRVINDAPGVTDSVRQAVLDAMDKLGYQPSARRPGPKPASRKGMRTGNILMLVLGFEPHEVYRMPVFPSLLHGVESALRESGMNLVLAGYHEDGPLPAALSSAQVDGVLVMGRTESLSPQVQSKLEGLASVGLMRGFDASVGILDRVLYNNRAVGAMAARYLLGRGHKRVAYVSLNRDHAAFNLRHDHFNAQIAGQGGTVLDLIAPYDESELAQADQVPVMRTLVQELCKARTKATAVFVPTDAYLPALYQCLAEQGVKPVSGLDIISCDNEDRFISGLSPRPATIDIHPQLIGRHAVRQLIWRLGNRDEQSRITVMVEPALIEPA